MYYTDFLKHRVIALQGKIDSCVIMLGNSGKLLLSIQKVNFHCVTQFTSESRPV